jgi:hypothetical protein
LSGNPPGDDLPCLNDSNGDCATTEVVLVRPPSKDCRELENFGAQKTLDDHKTNAEELSAMGIRAANDNREEYYGVYDNSNVSNPNNHGFSPPGGVVGNAISPPQDGSMHTAVHSHDQTKVQMFSLQDVATLRAMYFQRRAIIPNPSLNFFLPTGYLDSQQNEYTNVYALKITDYEKLRDYITSKSIRDYDRFEERMKNANKGSGTIREEKLEVEFLKLINGAGIDLYKNG